MHLIAEGIGSRTIAAVGLFLFGLAFKFYASWLSKKQNFDLDDSIETPAHEFEDGVDFVPTNRHVLFGHHFTSIAGAAPIVGPAIAVIWGWLPALLWVVFGSIFIGCVHDFANLVISSKNKGRSLADLTGQIVGPISRQLMLVLVMLLVWIVLAVFAFVIAYLFTVHADTIIPVNLEIVMAVIIGWMIYKKKMDSLVPSLIVLAILYAAIIFCAGHKEWVPDSLRAVTYKTQEAKQKYPEQFELALKEAKNDEAVATTVVVKAHNKQSIINWVFILLLYAGIASVLPVWLLLQPRDFINSHQLVVGLGLMFLAVLIFSPPVVAPAVRMTVDITEDGGGEMPLFPFLFITIACGAISGFHGLVASGTTSKQLNKMKDAKVIGYGAMLGEASLALMAVIACVAGFANSEDWHSHYGHWGGANGLGSKVGAFVDGGASFLDSIFQVVGVPGDVSLDIGKSIVAVLVISFAATTLDSACRIQRFIMGEIGDGFKIKFLSNRILGSILASMTPLILIFATDASGKPLWKALWPMFGATNQLLGAISLLVISIYLLRKGKNFWLTFVPMIFLMGMTFTSLYMKVCEFGTKVINEKTGVEAMKSPLLFTVGIALFALSIWITFESIRVLMAHKKGKLQDSFSLK